MAVAQLDAGSGCSELLAYPMTRPRARGLPPQLHLKSKPSGIGVQFWVTIDEDTGGTAGLIAGTDNKVDPVAGPTVVSAPDEA
jgi:hypothetical protein